MQPCARARATSTPLLQQMQTGKPFHTSLMRTLERPSLQPEFRILPITWPQAFNSDAVWNKILAEIETDLMSMEKQSLPDTLPFVFARYCVS